MGIFNQPPYKIITDKEIDRVLNTLRSRHHIPHELLQDWKADAMPHIKESGMHRGMSEHELRQYKQRTDDVTRRHYPNYHGLVKEFHAELDKALAKDYGGKPLGF